MSTEYQEKMKALYKECVQILVTSKEYADMERTFENDHTEFAYRTFLIGYQYGMLNPEGK